jgi:AAA domain
VHVTAAMPPNDPPKGGGVVVPFMKAIDWREELGGLRVLSETLGKLDRAPAPEEVRELEKHLGRVRDYVSPPAGPGNPIDRAWVPLPLTMLCETPPPRKWLLRHPTRDGGRCTPCTGDGLLPRGKAGILASAGGVGKTQLLVQLAISIVVGRNWLGHFEVDPGARGSGVLLALAEEDLEEVHRRMYIGAEALGLTRDERELVTKRVVALPLAGSPVALVAREHGAALIETPELHSLRRRLEIDAPPNGWAGVILDPLARWAGPDTEADNAAATRFVQAVESLVKAPGNPTVLVAHHSSKASRRDGTVDSRGVTAITDAFRWEGQLRDGGQDGVFFRQAKSNYSRPMPDEVQLIRGEDGFLRVPTPVEEAAFAEREEEREQEKRARRHESEEKGIASMMMELLAAIPQSRIPLTSRKDLTALLHGTQSWRVQAISRCLVEGKIERRQGVYVVAEGVKIDGG